MISLKIYRHGAEILSEQRKPQEAARTALLGFMAYTGSSFSTRTPEIPPGTEWQMRMRLMNRRIVTIHAGRGSETAVFDGTSRELAVMLDALRCFEESNLLPREPRARVALMQAYGITDPVEIRAGLIIKNPLEFSVTVSQTKDGSFRDAVRTMVRKLRI